MPTDAADRCKPLEEQYEKAQRELSYLVHEQKEEEKILMSLEENDQKLKVLPQKMPDLQKKLNLSIWHLKQWIMYQSVFAPPLEIC